MESGTVRSCTPSVWIILFIISATVNLIVILYLFLNVCITNALTRKILKDTKQLPKRRFTDDFIINYQSYLASAFADVFVSLILFGAGFYLLINGAVVQPFIMENSQSCQSVFVTAAVSAAVIGRLCATVFIGLQRINTFDTAKMAGKCSRQLLEHLFSIATLAVLLSTDEAPLTRALICIMSIDHHLCYFGFLVQKYSQWRSDKSIKRLKVIQCFLTMSCRGAVPLVSLIVSVSFFDADMLAMKLQSVIVFAACAFVYLFYNSWLIVTSTREVWFLYSRRTNDEVDKPTWVNRRANNELFPESKISPLQYLKNEFQPSKGDFHTKCNANKRFQQIRQFSSSSKRIPIKRIKGACNCRSASLSASEYQIPALAQPTTHNIAQLKPPTFRQSVLADLKDVEISNGTKRINGHLAKKSNHILDTIREETENLPVISTRK